MEGKGVGAEIGVAFETTGWDFGLEFRARYFPPTAKINIKTKRINKTLFDKKGLGGVEGVGYTG